MSEQSISSVSTPLVSALPERALTSRFSDLSKRLLGYTQGKETFKLFNPDKPGPWRRQVVKDNKVVTEDDYSEFRNSLLSVEEDIRIYTLDGHELKVVLKESYAKVQDEIRALRLMLENPATQAQAEKILSEHPFAKRALPEDLLPFIDELPNSRYFSRILLLEESNVEDLWVRQKKNDYNANFVSSAAVDPNGDLLFFKRDIDEYLRTDVFHEWAHRLGAHFPEAERAFGQAIMLEQRIRGWYYPSPYALTDKGEHWAVYGECMLAHRDALAPMGALPQNRLVFDTARSRSAPRALIFMTALRRLLESELASKSSMHEELLARCRQTEERFLQEALDFVRGYLTSDDEKAVAQAKDVLSFLDNREATETKPA